MLLNPYFLLLEMENLLPKEFYESTDVVQIAKNLLGKKLTTQFHGETTSGVIVETEAYKAPEDLASHAKWNRRTPRNETMFCPAGHSYVYICYGIHNLFNVVTGPQGIPHAVLIRAIEPLTGIETMMSRRKMNSFNPQLVNGPGKFTVAMGITMSHDRLILYDKNSPVWISDNDSANFKILAGPRVGMSHHTGISGHWPWRFRVDGNKWTSKPNVVKYDW